MTSETCPYDKERNPHAYEDWWEDRHRQALQFCLIEGKRRDAEQAMLRSAKHFHDFSWCGMRCLNCGMTARDYHAVHPWDAPVCQGKDLPAKNS